jgi:hypothetical protein
LALTPGTRLGVYDVTAQIGESRMGDLNFLAVSRAKTIDTSFMRRPNRPIDLLALRGHLPPKQPVRIDLRDRVFDGAAPLNGGGAILTVSDPKFKVTPNPEAVISV